MSAANPSSTLETFLALLEKDDRAKVNKITLHQGNPYFGDEHLPKIAQRLEISQHVKVLELVAFTEGGSTTHCISEYGVSVLADMLKVNTSICQLSLERHELTDNDAIALAEMLKVNRTLQSLNLEGNRIGDKGIVAIAEALKSNTSLRELKVGGNKFTFVGLYAVLDALHINSSLTSFNFPLPRNGSSYTQDYVYAPDEMKRTGEMLKRNCGIKHLKIHGVFFTDKASVDLVDGLKVNTTIESAVFRENGIGIAEMGLFGELLQNNRVLKSLSFEGNYVFDRNFSAISVSYNAESSTTTTTEIKKAEVGDSQYDEAMNSWSRGLMHNSTLRCLSLFRCGIASPHIDSLCKALLPNTGLRVLQLAGNRIGDAGACALVEMLTVHRGIVDVNLANNNIGTKGLSALAKMLRVNTTLHSLNLSQLRLASAGDNGSNWSSDEDKLGAVMSANDAFVEFCQALTINSSLSKLGLSLREIDANKMHSLATMLQENTSLTSLNLQKVYLDEKAAATLATALLRNTSVCSLNLISDWGLCNDQKTKVMNKFLSILESQNKTIRTLKLNSLWEDVKKQRVLPDPFQRLARDEEQLFRRKELFVEKNTQYYQETLFGFLSPSLPIKNLCQILVDYVALVEDEAW
jgi:Ran GTPase-activating protein (RanGAP) involved in mRNA processing and transport